MAGIRMQTDTKLSWFTTALVAAYVAWTGYALATRVAGFSNIFAGLGAEVPPVTRLAIAACNPWFVGPGTILILVILIVKEFRVSSLQARTLWNLAFFFAAATASAVVTEALFRPMLHLIQQVG